jgi:hypothetical protein
MTNGQMLREMTDAELAAVFYYATLCHYRKSCEGCSFSEGIDKVFSDCNYDSMLHWIKKERCDE